MAGVERHLIFGKSPNKDMGSLVETEEDWSSGLLYIKHKSLLVFFPPLHFQRWINSAG